MVSWTGGDAAVGVGAAVGAWLRWGFSLWLNPRAPALPLGTLASNSSAATSSASRRVFLARDDLRREWRLLVITGFLGGLTTFSTFSAEVTEQLMRGDSGTGLRSPRASRGLAAAHARGLRDVSRAGRVTRHPLRPKESTWRTQSASTRPAVPKSRMGRGRRRRARTRRSARAPHGDRRQLHRHLSSQRPVPLPLPSGIGSEAAGVVEAVGPRRRLGEARRSRRLLRRTARRVQRRRA